MPKKQPIEQRFWSKVKIGKPDECWEWKAYKDKDGYGTFWVKPSFKRAHRMSYELSMGKIPNGKFCCHSCDNPSCVNPKHIWIGTNRQNVLDSISKRRSPIGEFHHKAKLKNKDIKQIRNFYKPNTNSLSILSNRFGVSKQSIWRVAVRKSWKHIG